MATEQPEEKPQTTDEDTAMKATEATTKGLNNNSEVSSNVAATNSSSPVKTEEDAVKSEDKTKADDEENKSPPPLTEEQKKMYANWPRKNVKEPHPNDVLFGRGGGTNHHPGNKLYRKMVEERKVEYVKCKRLDKPMVALQIIEIWRAQVPPGRFLKMDDKTGLWNDVGDKKAREKTSQALREKAPIIRQELEKEQRAAERRERGEPEVDSEDEVDRRTTRFAEGTNLDGKPGVVARDHSLGRDYVSEDGVSLDNFSWFGEGRQQSGSSATGYPYPHQQQQQQPPQMPPYGYPGSRTNSGTAPPPYPPQGYPQQVPSYDGRVMSWSAVPTPPQQPQHQQQHPPPMPPYGYPQVQQSNSWSQRDHSLAMNPLPNATATQPGYPTAFDHRATSGQWAGPPPPPPPQGYSPYPVQSNSSYPPPGPPPPPQHHVVPPPSGATMMNAPSPVSQYPTAHPAPPMTTAPVAPSNGPPMNDYSNSSSNTTYAVDPAVASQWSTSSSNLAFPPQQQQQGPPPPSMAHHQPNTSKAASTGGSTTASKPDMVKRATSHQNETAETRPGYHGGYEDSIKRATLDRERSLASSRMKEQYNQDHNNSSEEKKTDRPSALTLEERMSTLDLQTLEESCMNTAGGGGGSSSSSRPQILSQRISTVEALALDFDHPDGYSPSGLEDLFEESVPKPRALESRMTTRDLIDIVNEPFEEV